MNQDDSVASFVRRLGVGDADASEQLFARYASRLARLAERHLSRELAARADGEDVVQSVFRTFFRRSARGEFHIASSARLWRLLVTITLRKVRTQARRHTAGVRDVSAEVGITSVQDLDGSGAATRRRLFHTYQQMARDGRLTCRIDLRCPIAEFFG